MRNEPKIFVEGRTLGEIARAAGITYKTINDRYHSWNGDGNVTVDYLTTDRRYKWSLVGLDVEQWLRFIACKAGAYLSPGQLRGWVYHRRAKGIDDKEIARELLARHRIRLPRA